MKKFLRLRWVLLLVLGVFIAIKIPHLPYPYYWDESWPYASAIRAMHNNGLSLMPNAIDADLSRGHPLLLHILAAGWMKVFGNSHIAMHLFALLISLCFLVVIYEIGLRLFNLRVAILALLLVATQEAFIVQSTALLPEVLVAFLCFLSLYCYAREKHVLAAVFLSMLFYTKESGLMMGFVLGVDAWVAVFNKKIDRKMAVRRLLSVAVPCVLIGLFFLLQKYQNGWYIFPLHTEVIEHSWKMYWYRFRMAVVTDVVFSNLKYYYFILIAVIAIIAAIKNKTAKYLVYLLPFVICYYFVDDMRAGRILPPVPFFILFIIAWLWCAYVLSRLFTEQSQRRFFVLGACFLLVYIGFSATGYYTYRYVIAAIVPMLFIAAVLLDVFIASSYRWLFYLSLVSCGVVSWFALSTNNGYGDIHFGAYKAMEVEQGIVDYMEKNNWYNKRIATGSFLEVQHITDPATGFLRYNKPFKNITWAINDATEVIIFNSIEKDYRYEDVKKNMHFKMVYRYERGLIWSEIYERHAH